MKEFLVKDKVVTISNVRYQLRDVSFPEKIKEKHLIGLGGLLIVDGNKPKVTDGVNKLVVNSIKGPDVNGNAKRTWKLVNLTKEEKASWLNGKLAQPRDYVVGDLTITGTADHHYLDELNSLKKEAAKGDKVELVDLDDKTFNLDSKQLDQLIGMVKKVKKEYVV